MLVLSALLLMTVNAFANEESLSISEKGEIQGFSEDKQIESIDLLEKEIEKAYSDGKMTDAESKQIIENSSKEVLCMYMNEKMEQSDEIINSMDLDVDEIIEQGQDGQGSITIDIGDNCKAVLEFEDKEEPGLVASIAGNIVDSCYAASNGEEKWKKYGNRYFTAKKTVLSGIGGAVIKLENHYKVSSTGLDERYGDAYVSFSFSGGITGNISANTPVITDKSARTPGKSDINMYARYPYYFNGQGIVASSGTYKLSTAVKYLKKDSKAKKIKVKHSWSLS